MWLLHVLLCIFCVYISFFTLFLKPLGLQAQRFFFLDAASSTSIQSLLSLKMWWSVDTTFTLNCLIKYWHGTSNHDCGLSFQARSTKAGNPITFLFLSMGGGIGVYMSISKSLNIFALSFLTQPIDYEGFQLFMVTYLENDIPEELCQHLFTSFKSKTGGCSPDQSRAGTSLLGRMLVLLS